MTHHHHMAEHLARRHSYVAAEQREIMRDIKRTGRRIALGAAAKQAKPTVELKPLSFAERSGNELRPATFDQLVGQDRLKALLERIVNNAQTSGRPLDHMLLAGQSGTGKTTLGQVVAHELGATVYQVKAPVSHAVLEAMATTCHNGDVVIVDEIHQQVSGDRRGITQACDPEDFYHVMEDRRLPTEGGMVTFPAVTFIGCTTDVGLLPEAFINRFPLALTLDPYTMADMAVLAVKNARQLGVTTTVEAAVMLGRASRRNPRQLNTYVRNAISLGCGAITEDVAREVIVDLNGCTLDGLTIDMQKVLTFLYSKCRRESRDGLVRHQASVNALATATGHSRDTKAIALFIETELIHLGLLTVEPQGRRLTDAGIERAKQLCNEQVRRG